MGSTEWGPASLQNQFDKRHQANEQELEIALNDLLISIYSQRPESEYQEHYFKLIEKLHWQNNHVFQSINSQLGDILTNIGCVTRENGALPQAERGTKATLILGFFLMKIKSIMVQLKRQLVEQAISLGVLEQVIVADNQAGQEKDKPGQYTSTKMCLDVRTNQQRPALVVTRVVKSYKQCPGEYDAILEALSDYFQNFKSTSDTVESIWLQVLKFFELQVPHSHTMFLQQHYVYYVEKVLDSRALQLIIQEADRWRETAHASEALDELLCDIEEIRSECTKQDILSEPYDEFHTRVPPSSSLNRSALAMIQEAQRKDQQILKKQLLEQQK